ncbi:MAG TPA: TlpA disulfide reductase family protein, partial [Bacteroidota bacterium]|nr:TlpA disulfide reductase family protein [Bacteroidota bacterium]
KPLHYWKIRANDPRMKRNLRKSLVGFLVIGSVTFFAPYSADAQDWVFKKYPPTNDSSRFMNDMNNLRRQIRRALNHSVPNLCFQNVHTGRSGSLDSLRGNVLLLDFWNMRCGVCKDEMPELHKVQSEFGKSGFILLTLSPDDAVTQQLYFRVNELTKEGIAGMLDLATVPYPFQGWAVPMTYLIDRNGVLRHVWFGKADPKELGLRIRKLL